MVQNLSKMVFFRKKDLNFFYSSLMVLFLMITAIKIEYLISCYLIIFTMKEDFIPYRSQRIRFFVLFLVSMVVFGNQYAFNNPQALEIHMEEDLGIG
jgi:hypothetical protein